MNQPTSILHEHLPMIEVAEAWMLDILFAETTMQGKLVRLDKHVAAVAPDDVELVRTRLRALGYTPKVVAE